MQYYATWMGMEITTRHPHPRMKVEVLEFDEWLGEELRWVPNYREKKCLKATK